MKGIHRWPVDSPHKEPLTRKRLPFHIVIMTFLEMVKAYLICVSISRQPSSTNYIVFKNQMFLHTRKPVEIIFKEKHYRLQMYTHGHLPIITGWFIRWREYFNWHVQLHGHQHKYESHVSKTEVARHLNEATLIISSLNINVSYMDNIKSFAFPSSYKII